MKSNTRALFASPASIPVVFLTSLIVYGIFQYTLAPQFFTSFHPRDSDDAMRLLSVRDLLAGQNWWDKTQYRVLPPAGLDLHWSRLIDGVLAIGVLAFRPFTDPETAERLVAAFWPALLFIAFLGLTARAAYEARGPSAAAFAMMAAALLPVININFFAFGRIDHHNVQVVCMIGLVGCLLTDTQHRRAGFAAGAFAAISISVGLEMLPFIGISFLIMLAGFLREGYGARDRMLAFGLSFGALSALLFPIEVAPPEWNAITCDRFGLPVLTVALGTMAYTLILAIVTRESRGMVMRLFLAVLTAAVVSGGIYVVVAPCLNGPFTQVSEEIRTGVIANILENAAARDLYEADPRAALSWLLPLVLLVPFLVFGPRGEGERLVAIFILLGLVGAVFQLRATIWGVAVLPLGFGLVIERLVNRPWKKVLRILKPFIVLGLAAVFFYPPVLHLLFFEQVETKRKPQDAACNTPENLKALNEVPRGLAMTPLNLSVPVLLYTNHSVTSAPYHTHPAALDNGLKYHAGTPEEFREGLKILGADFAVVCPGSGYGPAETAGARLANGETLEGLSDLKLESSNIRVLFLSVDPPVLNSEEPTAPTPTAPQEEASPQPGPIQPVPGDAGDQPDSASPDTETSGVPEPQNN